MIADMDSGKPAMMFAYGLSGSGKTYTSFGEDKEGSPKSWFNMTGPDDPVAGDRWGLFPRLAWHYFKLKEDDPAIKIELTFIQNVVNDVYDLMSVGDPRSSQNKSNKSKIAYESGIYPYHRGHANGNFQPREVTSFAHLCTVFQKAAQHKEVQPTQNNRQSTRGHVVVTFQVTRTDGAKGRFYICDLAGAEAATEIQSYKYRPDPDDPDEWLAVGPDTSARGMKRTRELQEQGKAINMGLMELQTQVRLCACARCCCAGVCC